MLKMNHLQDWIGRSEAITDTIDVATCRRMEAMLDLAPALNDGDALPPLWHWCYFHNPARQSLLGRDGHAEKGEFLPPVPLPRRMWAGGRFLFENPLPVGGEAEKISTIKSIEAKHGRSGPLCFVTIEHRVLYRGKTCFVEEHDIVYREDPAPGARIPQAPQATLKNPDFHSVIRPDPVLLFRYSALTFNSHRIHYDRDYCRDVEGYPGLVFHGPLTATLLADIAVRSSPGKVLQKFTYRAISPVFDIDEMRIEGKMASGNCTLQAVKSGRYLVMKACARFDA